MSDNHQEPNEGGFHLNTDGLNCLPCKCRKKTFHKETKINTEGKTIIVDKSSWKIGRGSTPDDGIFKEGAVDQTGSVEICDTGWGQKKVTPEECEQRIEKLETDVERIDKDVTILKNNLNTMD